MYIVALRLYLFVCKLQYLMIIMHTCLKATNIHKACRYIVSILWLHLFSKSSFMQYMSLCVFSLSISLWVIVRIILLYFIIIMKLENESLSII